MLSGGFRVSNDLGVWKKGKKMGNLFDKGFLQLNLSYVIMGLNGVKDI